MSEPLFPLLGISRHRLTVDGEGVTSLVSGAGCPLRCRWCINQELLSRAKATEVTAAELYERVRGDDLYFRATGGGITFGGGESLLHAPFFAPFRAQCGDAWRLYAETSLAVPRENVALAAETIDGFIVDCKDTDPETYRAYTGGDEALMEENLRFLLAAVGPERVLVRVPLIPEYNTREAQRRSRDARRAMGVTRLELFDYILKPIHKKKQQKIPEST